MAYGSGRPVMVPVRRTDLADLLTNEIRRVGEGTRPGWLARRYAARYLDHLGPYRIGVTNAIRYYLDPPAGEPGFPEDERPAWWRILENAS